MKKKNRSTQEWVLGFIKLTHRFQNLPRMVRKTGKLAWENNAEHSYQLELTCLYLIDILKLNLDRYKVVMYAKFHDWPEVYNDETGDHCDLIDKPEILSKKPEEEKKARAQLKKDLPNFPTMHEFIHAYEERKDPESLFVYSIDKLVSFWNIILDDGLTWKQFNTTLDKLIRTKEHKIRKCPIGSKVFDEILVIMRSRNGELFGSAVNKLPDDKIVPMPASRVHRLNNDQLSNNLVVLNSKGERVSA